MNFSLIAILFSSLMGSAHCLLMCGGIAAACKTSPARHGLLSYQLGRGISYTALGAFAGFSGSLITRISPLAVIFMATLLIIYGVAGMVGFSKRFFSTRFTKLASLMFRIVRKTPFLIGLATVLLPCGWLYSFVALAAVQGSALQGAIIMFVFWIGTFVWLSVPVWAIDNIKKYFGGEKAMYGLIALSGFIILFEHLQHPFYVSTLPSSNNQEIICTSQP